MVMAQLMGAYMFVTDFLWDIHKIHNTAFLLAHRVIVNFTFHRENVLTHRLTENGKKKPNVCLHRNFAFFVNTSFITFCCVFNILYFNASFFLCLCWLFSCQCFVQSSKQQSQQPTYRSARSMTAFQWFLLWLFMVHPQQFTSHFPHFLCTSCIQAFQPFLIVFISIFSCRFVVYHHCFLSLIFFPCSVLGKSLYFPCFFFFFCHMLFICRTEHEPWLC